MNFMDDEEDEIDDAIDVLDKTLEQDNKDAQEEEQKSEQFSSDNPPWVNDDGLTNGKVVSIKREEKAFWNAFLAKYLKPLDEDKAHQDKVKAELIDLRNKAVFGFGIINIIFVLFVYLVFINLLC